MSDQTTTPTESNPDRFVWDTPLIQLQPDEVYVPATIEELREGKSGRIIKDPALAAAHRGQDPAMVASAAEEAAKAIHPSRWRRRA